MSFFVELWESVFTPGTTPALIKATHASFILLIISLLSLIYLSRSIHFINLLVIAILLYVSVIWFINELNQAKLKGNEQLNEEPEDSKDIAKVEAEEASEKVESRSTGVQQEAPVIKRKA